MLKTSLEHNLAKYSIAQPRSGLPLARDRQIPAIDGGLSITSELNSRNELTQSCTKAIQQERLREADQARLAGQATRQMTGYEFFFRSQPIFNPKQAGRLIYVVVDGEVAIFQNERLVERVGPGHFLAEASLPPASGLVAVAHTDCRLVAINEVTLAVLVQCPPQTVVWVIRLMAGLPQLKSEIRWPARPPARPNGPASRLAFARWPAQIARGYISATIGANRKRRTGCQPSHKPIFSRKLRRYSMKTILTSNDHQATRSGDPEQWLHQAALVTMNIFHICLGHRLGLYQALAGGRPLTAAKIAVQSGAYAGYIRDWLQQQARAGILEIENPQTEPAERRFRLPPAHAQVLVAWDRQDYRPLLAEWLPYAGVSDQ